MTLTGANYNVLWDKSDNALEFADSAKAIFGTGGDLEIYHDGSNSYLSNSTGTLNIRNTDGSLIDIFSYGSARIRVNAGELAVVCNLNSSVDLYHNNVKKFETLSTGAKVTGNLRVNGHADLYDDERLRLGDSADLQIYHDGTNSYLQNTTGDLRYKAAHQQFRGSNDENMIIANQNGAVELYYNNSKKFETTSGGIDLPDQLQVDGTVFATGGLKINSDSTKLRLGASDDLQIYHNGSDTYFEAASTAGQIIHTANEWRLQNLAKNENMILANQDGLVRLFYNGSTKFETTSTGVTVTGTVAATSYTGDGSNLTGVSAGATGGGSDEVFYENGQTVTTSYSITSNKNAMSAGPLSINSGAVVTIPSGSVWTIV